MDYFVITCSLPDGLEDISEAEILRLPHEISKPKPATEGCENAPQIRLVWDTHKTSLALGLKSSD